MYCTFDKIKQAVSENPDFLLKQLGIARISSETEMKSEFYQREEENWLIRSIAKGLVEQGLVHIEKIPQEDGSVKVEARAYVVDINALLEMKGGEK